MRTRIATACFVMGTLLAPVVGYTEDSDMVRSHPKAYVKDSAITTKIKAKLAAEHLSSVAHIGVDTGNNGVVWLSGTAKTGAEADQAVAIARSTKGVSSVKDNIKINYESLMPTAAAGIGGFFRMIPAREIQCAGHSSAASAARTNPTVRACSI